MSGTDDLAGLLAEHGSLFASMSANQYVCSGCREYIGPLYYKTATRTLAAHQAAVIAAAGWVKGREEFGVRDGEDVDEIEPSTRGWAERVAATGITATHAWNQFWRWYYRGIGR